MKIKLVEAPNVDLSQLKTPTPKDMTKPSDTGDIESSEDIKDWDDNLLNANEGNRLTLTQMWLDDTVKNKLLANSSISFLQLVYDWIISFKTTDPKKNPLINQLLYVTNELEYKITYDSLVTLNNAYDSGIIGDKDLMDTTRLGIFQNMEFWTVNGKDQDQYVDFYQYLGDKDGGGKLLRDVMQQYKELNKNDALQLKVFESTQERTVGNLTSQSNYSYAWWSKNLDKFRDAIVFIGNVQNLTEYKDLKLRPLDQIRDWINNQFNGEAPKPKRGASKSQVNELKKIMANKNLSNDDVKTIYSTVDALKGELNAV